jgi:hypothetical protein
MMVIGLGKRLEDSWSWQTGEEEQFWATTTSNVKAKNGWQDIVVSFKGFSYSKAENENSGIDIYSLVIVPDVRSPHADEEDWVAYFDEIVVDNNPDKRFTSEMYALTYDEETNMSRTDRGINSVALTSNGKSYTATDGAKAIGVWAFTKENFSSLTKEQRDNGPIPIFEESTFSFGRVKQGTVVHATFKAGNEGKETLKIYKVDINACKWSHSAFPAVAPRDEVEFRVHLDTSNMPKGEALAIVTLITNSPLRPIVNLYIAGWLD